MNYNPLSLIPVLIGIGLIIASWYLRKYLKALKTEAEQEGYIVAPEGVGLMWIGTSGLFALGCLAIYIGYLGVTSQL